MARYQVTTNFGAVQVEATDEREAERKAVEDVSAAWGRIWGREVYSVRVWRVMKWQDEANE